MLDPGISPVPPCVFRFIAAWTDISERFCSAMWHAPIEGHNVAVDAKLGPEHFPDPMLWALVRLLSACAQTGNDPTVNLVATAMHELGEPATAPDLERIHWRESTAAGLTNYATMMIDFARRRELRDRIIRLQDEMLDTFERVGDVVDRIIDELRDWQAGVELPEPPKLRRPPAIVIRPRNFPSPKGPPRRHHRSRMR